MRQKRQTGRAIDGGCPDHPWRTKHMAFVPGKGWVTGEVCDPCFTKIEKALKALAKKGGQK